jgi:hypothetical protein
LLVGHRGKGDRWILSGLILFLLGSERWGMYIKIGAQRLQKPVNKTKEFLKIIANPTVNKKK